MAAEPRVWVLSGGRRGDLDQMLALTRAAGWPYDIKELSFRGPRHPLLARLETPLSPPWPDLAICAEALPSVIARRIKQGSSGATRIVCLGRPAGATAGFDLVVTTAQYRLPRSANVLELAMPLTGAAAAPSPAPADGPLALLAGGPAFPDVLNAAVAGRLAADVLSYAGRRNLRLHVETSPRTPPDAVAVFERAITAPHSLSVFGRGENRFRQVLAEAVEIIVTSDSVSMLSDTLAAGRPVSIYRLPQDRGVKWRLGEWLYRHAVEHPSPLLRPVRALFDRGVIEPAADRQRLFARLVAEKRLVWFGDAPVAPDAEASRRDAGIALARLRQLMTS